MKTTIKVSQETKDTIEALFWFFEPENVLTSSSEKHFSMFRKKSCIKEPKEVVLEVE